MNSLSIATRPRFIPALVRKTLRHLRSLLRMQRYKEGALLSRFPHSHSIQYQTLTRDIQNIFA